MWEKRNCLYKQFFLFPQCFQKASFPDLTKGVTVWERVKLMKVVDKRTGKIVGKGENAGNQHFLLFSLSFQKASLSVKTPDVLRINPFPHNDTF